VGRLPASSGNIYDIDNLKNVKIKMVLDVAGSGLYSFVVPAGHRWVILGASVINSTDFAIGKCGVRKNGDPTTTLFGSANGPIAAAIGQGSNCLQGILAPFILDSGDLLRLYDSNFTAGDTVTWNVLYLELLV
jgi:hypothetical protein